MARAVAVLAADLDADGPVRDSLLLDHAQRRNPHGVFTGLRGTAIEMALPQGQRLRADDRLLLDDGGLIDIVPKPEPLIEVRAETTAALARLAWLLGDHHIPAEIHPRRLRLLGSDMARALLTPLGARLTDIEAPFEPEGGAYDHDPH